MIYLWVGFAGGLGAALRLLIGRLCSIQGWGSWPVATLSVNVIGSFFIGLLLIALNDQLSLNQDFKTALTTGFLGGFTTFSAFSYEAIHMLDQGQPAKSISYVLVTVMMCLIACYVGMCLARIMVK